MDKKVGASTEKPPQKASSSSTPTDDESITISTESETFETWTLVKDKNKKKPAVAAEIDDNGKSKSIEIPEQYKKDKHHVGEEHDEPKPYYDSNIDDLSDGISIISESESGGRVSPHPYLREHLQYSSAEELEQSFSKISLDTPVLPSTAASATFHSVCEDIIDCNAPSGSGATTDNQLLRQRRRNCSTSVNSTTSDKKSLQTVESIVSTRHIPPIVQRGLAGIFYVGVALAILALIGKLHYPEWRPLSTTSDSKSLTALEQKLSDMELQNNLMRAEIDILSKQVNYLSDLKENNRGNRAGGRVGDKEQLPTLSSNQRQQQPKRAGEWVMEHKGRKTFKAWSGNGKSMQPQYVTKEDLKRPYKCPDGKYVEIAGMCVEDATDFVGEGDEEVPLIDEIGNIIKNIFTEPQTYETVKSAVDELQTVVAESDEEEQTITAPTAPAEFKSDAKIYSLKDEQKEDKRANKREEKYQKHFKRSSYTSAEYRAAAGPNSKEHGKYEKWHQYHKQQHQHKHHEHDDDDNDNDDDDDDDDSKEVHKKHDNQRFYNNNKNQNDNSKENSKERFDKQQQRRKFSTSSEEQRFHKDGQWLEKLMEQRENVRRKNERQRNDKNWYIERGDSREQMRHS